VEYAALTKAREASAKGALENVGERHVEAVVRHWWIERKVSPKTLQNYLSRSRIFFGWVGKPGLVGKASKYLPEIPASTFVVGAVATVSKAWTSQGVDVSEKIAQAFSIDLHLGLMLIMQLAFGLRRKEVIMSRPWKADRGTVLRIYPDEAKGSRPRDIPIETEFQREVLDRVKSHIGKTKALGWECMVNGRAASHKQRLDRYKNYMQALGITKAMLGVTGHGLRAQFAENACGPGSR
jgi:integrase